MTSEVDNLAVAMLHTTEWLITSLKLALTDERFSDQVKTITEDIHIISLDFDRLQKAIIGHNYRELLAISSSLSGINKALADQIVTFREPEIRRVLTIFFSRL